MALPAVNTKLENSDCFKVQFTPKGSSASVVYLPQLTNSIFEDATFYKTDFEKFADDVSVYFHQIQTNGAVDSKIL